MKRWALLISGRVQGVCYRMSVWRYVEQNLPEVKGFVQNLPDRRVEVVAEGNLDDLNKLYQYCLEGSSASRVDNIELIEKESCSEFEKFTILQSYT